MVQYIPRQNPGEKLTQGIGQEAERFANIIGGIQERKNQQKELQSENEALKQMGIDLSGISNPETRKLIISEKLKGQNKGNESTQNFQSGLETIQRMRDIGNRGNLGRGSGFLSMFGGERARDFGEYEQLGKSLISLASNIPIRNQQEFATLAENLFDPTLPDSQRDGILTAMERIIKQSMGGGFGDMTGRTPGIREESKQKPKLSSFFK